MPKRPSKPVPSAGTLDPDLVEGLVELTEMVLDEYFFDPEAAKAYRRLVPGGKRRGPAGAAEATPLYQWDIADDGLMVLLALPRRGGFLLALQHDDARAGVMADYDVNDGTLRHAEVVGVEGDMAVLRRMVEDGTSLGDASDDDIEAMLGDLGEGAEADAPPPAATAADVERVQRMTVAAARRMARDGRGSVTEADRTWLEDTPQSLLPLLDGWLAASLATPRDERLVEIHLHLLTRQLEMIRFRLERGWDWAARMLDAFQDRLVELGRRGDVPANDMMRVTALLTEAKVPIRPGLGEALLAPGGGLDADLTPESMGIDTLRGLMAELADGIDGPYEMVAGLAQVTGVMPGGVRAVLAHEMALAPHPVLRDTVPLLLLDGAEEVRRAAAAALEQVALPDTLSPVALRRMIAVRNWLPETERAAVDRAIRRARLKGVDCAPWPAAPDLTMVASMIDGSGAQGILMVSPTGKTGMLCAALFKQGFGIRDIWVDPAAPRRRFKEALAAIQRETPGSEIDRRYLDLCVQHAIAIGLRHDRPPEPALLDVAERIGASDWRDRALDVASEIAALLADLPPAERSATAVAESLRRSGEWPGRERIAESWFEDDAAFRALVLPAAKGDADATLRRVLDGRMALTRGVWAERFLLLALWARSARDLAYRARQREFLFLADALAGERPLDEIPLMVAIARQSIRLARGGGW